MDEYVDLFVDKIPGATADEKKVWFYFLLLFVLVREIFPKNSFGSLCSGEIRQFHREAAAFTKFRHCEYQTE